MFVAAVLGLALSLGGPTDHANSASDCRARTASRATAVPQRRVKSRKARPKVKSKVKSIVLFHVNTKQEMRLCFGGPECRVSASERQKRVDSFFRCHHTNKQRGMSPRLVRIIYLTGQHFGGRRVEVVSGYRHKRVARIPGSNHIRGRACDFRVQGIHNRVLRDYLRRTYDKIGVGYYPNSSFVHLDVRPDRSAFWVDESSPGEAPIYVRPSPDDDDHGS
jgi:uncharacterized protein YcbK (DUF882 family)